MAMKVIGWVIITIIFFAFIAVVAGVCFIMPYFQEKNDDERLYHLENVHVKSSSKSDPNSKKEKFFESSGESVSRLPLGIYPNFQGEKKTSTATIKTTKKIIPSTDYKLKSVIYPSTVGKNWIDINQTEPLYPQVNKAKNPPAKHADKLSDFFDDQKTSPPTPAPSTVSSTEKITTLSLEPVVSPIWLVPETQTLMDKQE